MATPDEHFLPFLLAVVGPLAILARRAGLLSTPALRIAVGGLFLVLALPRVPWQGVDGAVLRRMHLLVAAGTVATLLLRAGGAPWLADPRRYRAALAALALAAVCTWTNFFSFHGRHTWAHLHDVAHYYLGSKYFREIGYGELYVAALRAEIEEFGDVLATEARELDGNYLVPVQRLLDRSGPVRDRFTPERWSAFRADVRGFRETMGPAWIAVVKDHGYNPTPVWALLGGVLANRVPAGSARGIFLLTLLDPLLLATAFAAVALTFGVESGFLAVTYFCLAFGGAFSWKGGAFLRELSLSAILASACLLARGRGAASGALLALAAMLRVYPALLAAGVGFRGAAEAWRARRIPRLEGRFVAGFALAALLLFGATALRPAGLERWGDFARNIARHGESASSNVIGLTSWLAYARSFDLETAEGFEAAVEWRRTAYRLQLATVFLLAVLFVAARSPGVDATSAMGLGTLLVFTGLNLSAYYYAFLALLVPVYRDRPRDLALLFSVELAVYAIALFEQHEVMLYLYKSLLLLWLFLALHVGAFREMAGRAPRVLRAPREVGARN